MCKCLVAARALNCKSGWALGGGRCLQKQMYINVLNLAEIFKVRSETRDVVGGGGVVGFAGSPWFRRPRIGV